MFLWLQVRLPVSGSVAALSTSRSRFADACHVALQVVPAEGRTWPQAPSNASTDDSSATAAESAPLQGMRAYLATCWANTGHVVYADSAEAPDGITQVADKPRDGGAEQGAGAGAGAAPQWVARRLVGSAKKLCTALRLPGQPEVDAARAYDTVDMLLHAIAISQGSGVIDGSTWAALETLCERVAERNAQRKSPTPEVTDKQKPAPRALQPSAREVQGGGLAEERSFGEQGPATSGQGSDADVAFQAALVHAINAPDALARHAGELDLDIVDDDELPGSQAVPRHSSERAGVAGTDSVAAAEEPSRGQAMLAQLRANGQL
jgi:hypothetical protein